MKKIIIPKSKNPIRWFWFFLVTCYDALRDRKILGQLQKIGSDLDIIKDTIDFWFAEADKAKAEFNEAYKTRDRTEMRLCHDRHTLALNKARAALKEFESLAT